MGWGSNPHGLAAQLFSRQRPTPTLGWPIRSGWGGIRTLAPFRAYTVSNRAPSTSWVPSRKRSTQSATMKTGYSDEAARGECIA